MGIPREIDIRHLKGFWLGELIEKVLGEERLFSVLFIYLNAFVESLDGV